MNRPRPPLRAEAKGRSSAPRQVTRLPTARTSNENGVSLVVQVEDDADHYHGRNAGPGKLAHQPREAIHS
jgi:hypothetical protein